MLLGTIVVLGAYRTYIYVCACLLVVFCRMSSHLRRGRNGVLLQRARDNKLTRRARLSCQSCLTDKGVRSATYDDELGIQISSIPCVTFTEWQPGSMKKTSEK